VLINLDRVGEKQQPVERPACACCAQGKSTDGSTSSKGGEYGPADCSSSAAASFGTLAQPDGRGAAAGDNKPPTTPITDSSTSSSSGGFDCSACRRDVLHLGDCDSAVMHLAQQLGWEEELQALVAAGEAALCEARDCGCDE
jgi:hypothetical protein